MSDDSTQAAPRRRPRWLLIGSLALNAFLVAAILGMVLAGPPDRRGPGGRIFAEFARDAAPETRGHLRTLREERREAIRASRPAFIAAEREVLAALRAEAFDRERLRAAMAERQRIRLNARSANDERLAALANQISPAERRRFADLMEKRLERRIARWDRRERQASEQR